MKDRFYNTDGCDDYCSFDGGGEIIDADIKLNDIVVFDVKETPIIKKNNHICLLWESQCTNVKLKGKLFRPTDGLCMSIEEQKFLLRYFSNIDINDFFEKTRAIIDQLNIDDIINSYDISYKMYWQVRPGKDDFEWYISHTKYTYSDPYIETLLPIEERTDYSTGCRPFAFDEKKENMKLQREAKLIANRRKKNAKETYSKFKHYNYLIKKYFEDRTKFEIQFNNDTLI